MCNFLSLSVDREGRIYCLLGKEREKLLSEGKNPDSHSFLCDYYGVDEDETWKFDFSFDYQDFKQGFKTIGQIEKIKSAYDGGLPLEEMPAEYLLKISDFLLENKDLIIEAGKIRFSLETLKKEILGLDKISDPQEWGNHFAIYDLPMEVTSEKFIRELGLSLNRRGWGNYYYIANIRIKVAIKLSNIVKYLSVFRQSKKYFQMDDQGNPVEKIEYRISIVTAPIIIKI